VESCRQANLSRSCSIPPVDQAHHQLRRRGMPCWNLCRPCWFHLPTNCVALNGRTVERVCPVDFVEEKIAEDGDSAATFSLSTLVGVAFVRWCRHALLNMNVFDESGRRGRSFSQQGEESLIDIWFIVIPMIHPHSTQSFDDVRWERRCLSASLFSRIFKL
jgi:hypothetical protein